MKLLFLDTETTGDGPDDRLCQLAYKYGDIWCNELFRPPLPIKTIAMSVNHITNEMVEREEEFATSEHAQYLQEILADSVLVAHNAKFDIGMLTREGLTVPRHICTLKVALHIDHGGKYESHRLQYLRYFYGIQIDATAHDAMGDVAVLEKVYYKLRDELRVLENIDDPEAADERMMEISALPTVYKEFNFGKYNKRSIKDVAASDRGYIEWLLNAKRSNPDGEQDWIYTLEEALK